MNDTEQSFDALSYFDVEEFARGSLARHTGHDIDYYGSLMLIGMRGQVDHYTSCPLVTDEDRAKARRVLDQRIYIVRRVMEQCREQDARARMKRERAHEAHRARARDRARRTLMRGIRRSHRAARRQRTRTVRRGAAKSRTGDSGDGPAGPSRALTRRAS